VSSQPPPPPSPPPLPPLEFSQLTESGDSRRAALTHGPGPGSGDPDDGNTAQPRRARPHGPTFRASGPMKGIEQDEPSGISTADGPLQESALEFQQQTRGNVSPRAQRAPRVKKAPCASQANWRVPAKSMAHMKRRQRGRAFVIEPSGPSHGRRHARPPGPGL